MHKINLFLSSNIIFSVIIYRSTGVDSIAADIKEQKITIIGEMDIVKIAKRLGNVGKIEIALAGPAKEEKNQEEIKEENKLAENNDGIKF